MWWSTKNESFGFPFVNDFTGVDTPHEPRESLGYGRQLNLLQREDAQGTTDEGSKQ